LAFGSSGPIASGNLVWTERIKASLKTIGTRRECPCPESEPPTMCLPSFHCDITGSNPVVDANKTKDLEKTESILEGLKGFDKKTSPSFLIFRNLPLPHDLSNHTALRHPLHLCHSLRVNIHRHLEVGAAKKLLDRLHILSVCLHQGSKGVAQRVSAHRFGDADGFHLSANCGSWLILKVSTRCGLSPCAYQMRRTLVSLMPTSRAIVRVDQCVALPGVVYVVL
jgi:hypothetical protein